MPKNSRNFYPASRMYYEGRSQLIIGNFPFRIQFSITGRITPRQRRALCLAIYDELYPKLKLMNIASIFHEGRYHRFSERDMMREVSFAQCPTLDDPLGFRGLAIRMQRLKLGMTQEEVAEKIGITRTHLSRIERGVHRPHQSTLFLLARELEMLPSVPLKINRKTAHTQHVQTLPNGTSQTPQTKKVGKEIRIANSK